MIGSVAGAQRTGVKRKAEDLTHSKRAPGFPPSLQSSASPPRTSFTSVTPASSTQMAGPSASGSGADKKGRSSKNPSSHLDMEIESLLNQQSTKEQQSKKVRRKRRPTNTSSPQHLNYCKGELVKSRIVWSSDVNVISCQVSREILELLNASTAKEQSIVEKFRSRGRAQVQEFCDHGTKEECVRSGDTPQPCTKLHFRSVFLSVLLKLFSCWFMSAWWSLLSDTSQQKPSTAQVRLTQINVELALQFSVLTSSFLLVSCHLPTIDWEIKA